MSDPKKSKEFTPEGLNFANNAVLYVCTHMLMECCETRGDFFKTEKLSERLESLGSSILKLAKDGLSAGKSITDFLPSSIHKQLGNIADLPEMLSGQLRLWTVLATGLIYTHPEAAMIFKSAYSRDSRKLDRLETGGR